MKTDYNQIQELMALYAYAVDSKDYDGIAGCFTADAEAIYSGFSDRLKGLAEIGTHMKKALEALDVTQHLFTNFIVDVEGDAARFTCDVIAQHVQKSGKFMAGGKYKLEARRTAGKWKIARLSMNFVWNDGDRAMLPKAG
jgi:ketosteroid isomerase-like protein